MQSPLSVLWSRQKRSRASASPLGSPPKRTRGPIRLLALLQLTVFVSMIFLLCGGATCPGTNDSSGSNQFRPYFVYTANQGSNDITMFQANREGKLINLGRESAGSAPSDIICFLDNVYVANANDNTVSHYKIQSDGRLQLANTYPTGSNPRHLAVEATSSSVSSNLFVSCSGSNEVVIFKIPVGSATLEETQRLTVNNPGKPAKQYSLYVPSGADNKVYAYNDSISGFNAATPASATTGENPTEAITQTGELFVLNTDDHSLSTYDTFLPNDASSPHLAPLATINLPTVATSLTLDDQFGNNLYVLAPSANVINHFTIEDKVVSPVSGALADTGSLPTDLASANDGANNPRKFMYATTLSGTARLYDIQDDGSLTFIDSFNTDGTDTVAIAVSDNVDLVPPLTITTTTLPDGAVGTPYSADLNVSGGLGDLGAHFHVVSGNLPNGLSFDEPGSGDPDRATKLSGTPTAGGTFTFSVVATEGSTDSEPVSFTVTITGGGGGGGTVDKNRFANASTLSTLPLSLTLGSTTFGPQAFGTISGRDQVPTGTVPFTLKKSDNSVFETGNVHTDSAHRNVFIALGGDNATKTVAQIIFDLDYAPPAGQAAVTVVNGIDQPFTVDVYCLVGSETVGTATRTQMDVAYTDNPTFEVPAAQTYTVVVTFHGNPADVIATTGSRTISDGQSALEVVVSPPSASAFFCRLFEQ